MSGNHEGMTVTLKKRLIKAFSTNWNGYGLCNFFNIITDEILIFNIKLSKAPTQLHTNYFIER